MAGYHDACNHTTDATVPQISLRRLAISLPTLLLPVSLALLPACSDEDGGDDPVGGAGGEVGGAGGQMAEDATTGRPDFALGADAEVEAPDMMIAGGAGGGAGDPDMGLADMDVAEPDMDTVDPGPRPETTLVASVVLTQTPGEGATIDVAVTEPVDLGNAPGCVVVFVDPEAESTPRGFDGGDIVITGPNGGPYTFTASSDPSGIYRYAADRDVPDNLFIEGTVVDVEGMGGPHLDPFTAQITAPGPVQIQAPPAIGYSQGNDEALPVRWTAGSGDTLLITLIPMGGDPFSPEPVAGDWGFCAVEDNGNFTVGAEVVGQVIPNPAAPLGSTMLVGLSRTKVVTGEIGAVDQSALSAITNGGALVTVRP